MEWAVVAQLIAQYGLPFAEFLIAKINTKGTVSPEEWASLKALANVNARQVLTERLKAAGIDPASTQGAALLALVPS
jgi:hypothetical protein